MEKNSGRIIRLSMLNMALLSVFFDNQQVLATNGDPIGFSVKAVTPEKQIDLNKTFFYIMTEPNQAQKLEVDVTNNEENAITIDTTVANAITGSNGKISYVAGIKDRDKTLTNSIEDITSVEPKELVIEKGETKQVTITVTPPHESYEGIKLGTIYFEKNGVNNLENTAQVKSKYRYAIDLLTSESDEVVYGGKKLTLDSVEATLFLRKKIIALQFSNADPKLIQDLRLKVQIQEKESGRVLRTAALEDGRMAPNSHFMFEVPWGLETFKAGTYVAKVKADSNTDDWSFEEEFTITSDQARIFNKETITKLRLPMWTYVVFGSSVVLFLGLTFFLRKRQNKWKSKLIDEKRKKKRKNRERGTRE